MTTAARREQVIHHRQRSAKGNEWVIPVIIAAWVIVVLCGYLVGSGI